MSIKCYESLIVFYLTRTIKSVVTLWKCTRDIYIYIYGEHGCYQTKKTKIHTAYQVNNAQKKFKEWVNGGCVFNDLYTWHEYAYKMKTV